MAKVMTETAVSKFVKGATRQEVPDALVPGLYLVVQPSGKKSWAVRYRVMGKPQKFTLGGYPALPLAKARESARSTLEEVARGQDPAAAKKERKRAEREGGDTRFLLENIVTRYLDRYAKKRTRESSWQETERLLEVEVIPDRSTSKNKNAPTLRGHDIRTLRRQDIKALLDAIIDRGVGVTANRTLAALRKLLNWAVEQDIIEASPAEGIKALAEERGRDRILSDGELTTIFAQADKLGHPFGTIVKLLALTAQRRSEVAGMTWAELNLDAAVWTIPADRAKNGRAHAVPLSAPAVALLKATPRLHSKEGLVFTTTGTTPVSGLSKAKARIDAGILEDARKVAEDLGDDPDKVAPLPRWTLHDLRRTAATGMARLRHPVAVIERVLNHTSGVFRGIVGVYQLHEFAEEKRAALDDWAQHVVQITAPKPQAQRRSNVVSIAVGGR